MIWKLFFSDGGTPKTGLSPTISTLNAIDGTDKSGDAPDIAEVGGGWYALSATFGTAPFDVDELVGVIDSEDATMSPYERFLPITLSKRDIGLARLVNKVTWDIGATRERTFEDDGTTVILDLTKTTSGGVATLDET